MAAETHVVLLGASPTAARPALRKFADASAAFAALEGAAGLLIELPMQNYGVLVAMARKRTPPIQVLVLSDEPSATRRELHRLGLSAEVLARPSDWSETQWSEILRRFGVGP